MAATVTAFDPFEFDQRWVGWKNEPRADDPTKTTKIPYCPHARKKAKADNPATWGTRSSAETWARQNINGGGGGIGIELGDLGNGWSLGGVDLDTCRDTDGKFEPWAIEVIGKLASYTEISPSGTGAKVFFRFKTEHLPRLREHMGGAEHGKMFNRPTGSDHPPAIELHLARRYFAVTLQHLAWTPTWLGEVSLATLLWLLTEAGPAFAAKPPENHTPDPAVPPPNGSRAPQDAAQGGRFRMNFSGSDHSQSTAAIRLCLYLRSAGKSFEEVVEALRNDPETARWCAEKADRDGGRQYRRIWKKADPGPSEGAADAPESAPFAPDGEDEDFEAPFAPQFSEDRLALNFSDRHAEELRHCDRWGSWLLWDGTRWVPEKTLKAFDLARVVAREAANACPDRRTAPRLASAGTVAAIERLARSDRRHATTTEQWDADQCLLNTPGGLVDLRGGDMLAHDPAQYITKITAVAPGGECPLWRKFLDEITAGNRELQGFLQRVGGYCLTGSTKEHALFFCYGTGGNGKGVFLNTLAAILADYATVAPMETFIAIKGERHPTDLAGLRGARLVTAQETEQGRGWAESKIKTLTGGDPITARFMRQDFFTYTPNFKLVIAGNHKPGLRGVDEAIRRRFHLIPFTVTFAKPDRDLFDKLRPEWPGILQWMIEGCLEWQQQGLNPPAIVRDATATYLNEEDAISRWVEECCTTGPQHWCASALLWASWQRWAGTAGEPAGSQRRFSTNLESHGFVPGRTDAMRGFGGLDLIPSEKPRQAAASEKNGEDDEF